MAVRQVLRGLTYPAERWQILAHAELYGVDAATRAALFDLPLRAYRSPGDVASALDGHR